MAVTLQNQFRHNGDALSAGNHGDGGFVIVDITAGLDPQVLLFEKALDVGVGIRPLAHKSLATKFLGGHYSRTLSHKTGRSNADKRVGVERLKIQIRCTGIRHQADLGGAALEPGSNVGIAALIQLYINAWVLGFIGG